MLYLYANNDLDCTDPEDDLRKLNHQLLFLICFLTFLVTEMF